jgi:hypothetical protein
MGIPAAGTRVNVNGVVIDRVINGQMTDSRMLMNALSMLQQLGATPLTATPVGVSRGIGRSCRTPVTSRKVNAVSVNLLG